MVQLTTAIRHPGPVTIVTDCAPGFISLTKSDKDLRDLHITIKLKDQLNKNYNAVVDRACQDIEAEIRRLAPEGGKITASTLARAVISANARYRRKEGISAFELHTARSQDTGTNLPLDDSKLFQEQQAARQSVPVSVQPPHIKVGDTVTPVSSQPKHRVRDIYMVTGVESGKVSAQKLLHPLSDTPIKMMG